MDGGEQGMVKNQWADAERKPHVPRAQVRRPNLDTLHAGGNWVQGQIPRTVALNSSTGRHFKAKTAKHLASQRLLTSHLVSNIITSVITFNALERPMSALKLTQIGNSVGVILPKEVLTRLKLGRATRCI